MMLRLSLCIWSCVVLSGCGGGERVNPVNEKLKQEVAELSHKANQAEKEKAESAAESKILQSKLGDSLDKNARLKDEAANLRKTYESVASEKDELQKERQRFVEETTRLRKDVDGFAAEKEQLQKEVQDRNRDLGIERQLLQTMKLSSEQDQAELRRLKNPVEMFKKSSLDYLENLQPKKLFGSRSFDLVLTFRKKLSFLSDPKHLLEEPAPSLFTLPLPLVFDDAPRPDVAFKLYVSLMQGNFEAEQNAKFILATDDPSILGNADYYVFNVPAGFPILFLGRNTFMLPKILFDPLYESEDSAKFIPLVYDFENTDELPMGYEQYLTNLAIYRAKVDSAKSFATDIRQKELDAKNQATLP